LEKRKRVARAALNQSTAACDGADFFISRAQCVRVLARKILSQQQEIEQLSRRRTQCNKNSRSINLKIIVSRPEVKGQFKKKRAAFISLINLSFYR
jgi:hypothetical protein